MTAPLVPTWAMPATVSQTQALLPPPPYGTGFAFDFAKGDFVLDATGRVVTTEGETTWGVWCAKAVITQWQAYAVYTAQYGTDLRAITQAPTVAQAQATAQQALTDALLSDPRTRSVTAFAFTWQGDALSVSFTVTPVVGSPFPITVKVAY